MHRRNLLVALLALLATLPLTACSAKLPDPATAVKAATQNASEAKTVHFEVAMGLEGTPDPEGWYSARMSGAVDIASGQSWIHFTAGGFRESEIRVVDGITYTRLDDRWFASEDGEVPLADLFDPGSPLRLLQLTGGNESAIRLVGTEDVRGKTTQHYSVLIDAKALNGDVVDEFVLESEEVQAGVWVGDDNLPARLELRAKFDPDVLGLDGDDVIFVFAIDLFDWGKPVEVEAPPADQIVDIDDDPFGSGSFGDPFEGAKCYGDRVAECLGVNEELDAKADDPALCQGAEARVCLVPVGNVRTDIVDAIVKFHKETADIDVLVLGSIPMAEDWVTPESQVTEYEIYNIIKHVYEFTDTTPSTFIGITPIDIVPEEGHYAWMFGARFGSGPDGHNHGVFSTFRMENVEPYDGRPITDELVQLRASKYTGRYTALLHLDYPYTDDIDYLNYRDMFGFSDLDSIGTTWPTGDKPCEGDGPVVCIIPDGDYEDVFFDDELKEVTDELSAELGIRIEMRFYAGYYMPTLDDWGDEYGNDLRATFGELISSPNTTVIGVTDDPFAQVSSVSPSVDRAWPDERLAVVSAHDAGEVGSTEHYERLKSLLLRAIARAHYDQPLNSDPSSLLFDGITEPAELDGKIAPALP